MSIQIIILAAGQGKRMCSLQPKVLHSLAHKSLLQHVVDTTVSLTKNTPIVIYGHQGDKIRSALASYSINWIEQKQQLGTGHAVLQAVPHLNEDDQVLILCGDVPLISLATLTKLINTTPKNALGMLTVVLANPAGYGRIKRDEKQNIIGIVEEKDASSQERAIREINPSIYFLQATYLKQWLPQLQNNNTQQEYYLTDIVPLAVKNKIQIHAVQPEAEEEVLGVNDKVQLAHLERYYQQQCAFKLMQQGVTLRDPARLDIRGNVTIGRDVSIDVNVILSGDVVIGDNCIIESNVILRNVTLGAGVHICANSYVDGASIAAGSIVGPFARIRPGTVLAEQTHIGNFVEIKNSQIGTATKINHLSYVGDSVVGRQVNIGAGTITCNYDGVNKYKTIIEDNVFIGSCTQLIAPITVGAGATIGAGTTLTQDAPADQLTLARAPQKTIKDWQRPVKKAD